MFPAPCLPTEPLLLLRVPSCGLGGLRSAKSGSSPGVFHPGVPCAQGHHSRNSLLSLCHQLGYFLLHARGVTVTIVREEYHHIAFQLLPRFSIPSYCRISWKALSGLPASRSSPPSRSWTQSAEGVRFGESPEGATMARERTWDRTGSETKMVIVVWKPQVSCNRGQK